MIIRDIVAVDETGGMARAGHIPWHAPEDVAYFHEQSKRCGGHLLIGRGTYDAMKKGMTEREGESAWPPAGRHLYVLTSHGLEEEPGVTIIHSLSDFLADMERAGKDVWNGSIAAVEPDEIYLTRIAGDYGCDKFYPMERLRRYTLVSSRHGKPAKGEPGYVFEVYARSKPRDAKAA